MEPIIRLTDEGTGSITIYRHGRPWTFNVYRGHILTLDSTKRPPDIISEAQRITRDYIGQRESAQLLGGFNHE